MYVEEDMERRHRLPQCYCCSRWMTWGTVRIMVSTLVNLCNDCFAFSEEKGW